MMTKNSSTQLRKLWKQLAVIPVLAGLVFFVSIKQTTAQDIKKMSLSELTDSVNNRIESDDTLSAKEQDALQTFLATIQKQSESKPAPPPPPVKMGEPKKALKTIHEAYQKQVSYYNSIYPNNTNREKLEASYKKIIVLLEMKKTLKNKAYDNPSPAPPVPLKPAKKIKNNLDNKNQKKGKNSSVIVTDTTKEIRSYLKKFNQDEEKIKEYMNIEAVPANQQTLERFYKKLNASYRKAIKAYHKAKEFNKNIKGPHLPRPPKPAKRLGNQYNSKKSLMNISQTNKKQLDKLFEKLRAKFITYRNIAPVSANLNQLKTAYAEMKDAHSNYMDKRKAVYGNASVNFIPLLADPGSRIKDNAQQPSDNQQDPANLDIIESRYVTLTALYNKATPITQNRAKMESVLKKINAIYAEWNDEFKERDKNDQLSKPSSVNARMMVYYRYRPKLAQNNKEIQQVAVANYKKGRKQYMDVAAISKNKNTLQDKYRELSEYYKAWNSIMEQSDYDIRMQPLPNSAKERLK